MLAIHLRIYPIIYLPSIFFYFGRISTKDSIKSLAQKTVFNFYGVVYCSVGVFDRGFSSISDIWGLRLGVFDDNCPWLLRLWTAISWRIYLVSHPKARHQTQLFSLLLSYVLDHEQPTAYPEFWCFHSSDGVHSLLRLEVLQWPPILLVCHNVLVCGTE